MAKKKLQTLEQPSISAEDDFYFRCSQMQCVILASTCEKNRVLVSRVDSLMLNKQAAKCYKCPCFETEQQNERMSKAEYHEIVLNGMKESDQNKKLVKAGGSIFSEFRGKGRAAVRVN